MLQGLIDVPIWGYVVFTLVVTHITIVSVTVFLHRHQAHRALELHPAVSHFFRFWLWLTTGMVTREWVAVHRKHHARCETEQDPHSPQVRGIREVLWRGAELYRKEANNADTVAKYGRGAPDDWLERKLYLRHSTAGIGLMLLIDLALFGPIGLTIWAVQMLWIPFWAAGVINGIGHYLGYRNYACPDASRNIVPWGVLIGGEELHNNHHAYASSAKFSSRWYEFDIGWFYIRVLAALRLAHIKKVAPKPPKLTGMAIDLSAVKAMASARFLVMARYGKEVMARVHRDEVRKAVDREQRSLLKRARALLLREVSLLDQPKREHLDAALTRSEALRTVWQFRDMLQDIWRQSAASHEQLLHALQEWCRQAEQTGVQALQDFARRLRGGPLQQTMA